MLTEKYIHGGILLTLTEEALPEILADPIRERWQLDEEDDTVENLLREAALLSDAGGFLRPARVDAVSDVCVTLDGFPFRSELAAEKLHTPGMQAVGYVITCGRGLYDARNRWNGDFVAEAIWDEIMIAYLRLAGDRLHTYIETHFFPKTDGKKSYAALNPGSLPAWDIFGQRELFALLGDGAGAAGVELTESMLMLPTKSGSGIFFPADEPYENCMHCPRIDCPNRRAPYAGD